VNFALAVLVICEAGFVANSGAVRSTLPIPAGIVVPVQLERGFAVKEASRGLPLEGRVMQDVPLPDRGKIAMRSRVKGSIVETRKDSDGKGTSVTLRFDQLEDRKQLLSMTTSLRAIASYSQVTAAQTPFTNADSGSPAGWATTVQIGGDARYGDGDAVRNPAHQVVGKAVRGGVLVHVGANLRAGCEGPLDGDDHLQALWVFSTDACGVYGLKGLQIAHNGKSEPVGEITLHFDKDDMKLEAGTGMLLRVRSR
jgi:hypothetical protein